MPGLGQRRAIEVGVGQRVLVVDAAQAEVALGRQVDLAVAAAEQRQAQMLLQRLHLAADRRLGDVQLVRGTADALVARRRLEGAQGIEGR